MPSRLVVLLYGLIAYATALETAIVPLAPDFGEKFDLSKVEVGVLLAAPNAVIIVASVPAGVLADRFGAKALTTTSAVLFVLASVGQAFAPTYELLLTSWVVFGVGLAIVATSCFAWLAEETSGHRREGLLAGGMTAAGAGAFLGPFCAGVLAQTAGLAAPFVVSGVIAVALLGSTLATRMSMTTTPVSDRFVDTLSACLREPKAWSALVVVGFLGLVGGGVNLLVPLGLHAENLSSGEIGLVFSASAGIFVLVSAATARRRFRMSNVALAAVCAALYGVLMVIPIASLTALSLIVFVLARAPVWAVCATLAYPIGDEGARAAGIGRGAVFGLANSAWGVAAVVGPLITAWIAQSVSAKPAFAALAVASLTAAWLLKSAARERSPARDLGLEES